MTKPFATITLHSKAGAGLLAALLASTPAMGQAKQDCMSPASDKKTIEIRVDDQGQPYFHDKSCAKAAAGKGDICYDQKQRAVMRFKLMGEEANDWLLEGFRLSTDSTVFPSPTPLPLGAYSDFEFDTDAGLVAGRPYADITGQGKIMDVRNNNCHAFSVYYEVLLKDPDGNTQRLHPVIENSGTGQ